MPIVYMPRFMRDVDYKMLLWLDKHGGRSDLSFELLDYLNTTLHKVELAIKRLAREGMLHMHMEKDAIMEIELTEKVQAFLSEHILGQVTSKRSG